MSREIANTSGDVKPEKAFSWAQTVGGKERKRLCCDEFLEFEALGRCIASMTLLLYS